MSSQTLFVGCYSGLIHTFAFDATAGTLEELHRTDESAPGPSWQHLVREHGVLYSGCEGDVGKTGYIDAYKVGDDGSLTKVDRAQAVQGVVGIDIAKQGLMATAS